MSQPIFRIHLNLLHLIQIFCLSHCSQLMHENFNSVFKVLISLFTSSKVLKSPYSVCSYTRLFILYAWVALSNQTSIWKQNCHVSIN